MLAPARDSSFLRMHILVSTGDGPSARIPVIRLGDSDGVTGS